MLDHKLISLLEQWGTFTADREAERYRLQNPPGVGEMKTELAEVRNEMAKLRAREHLLKAKIAMAGQDEPYNRSVFDVEWSARKKILKEAVESAIMELMSGGMSVPTIMNEYSLRNPVWLYQIKDKLTQHQQTEAVKLQKVLWRWSDFTGTHRYALAKDEMGKWAYVQMKGTLDTELDGDECVWEIATGEFLTGSQDVFNSDSPSGRQKRYTTLAAVLDGTYTGAYRESPNPYYRENVAA